MAEHARSYTDFNARLEPLDRGHTDVRGGSYSSCLGESEYRLPVHGMQHLAEVDLEHFRRFNCNFVGEENIAL